MSVWSGLGRTCVGWHTTLLSFLGRLLMVLAAVTSPVSSGSHILATSVSRSSDVPGLIRSRAASACVVRALVLCGRHPWVLIYRGPLCYRAPGLGVLSSSCGLAFSWLGSLRGLVCGSRALSRLAFFAPTCWWCQMCLLCLLSAPLVGACS